MINELEELVSPAVSDLFRTMLGMKTQPVPPVDGFLGEEPHIAGVVGFVGKLDGIVYVHTTQAFARQITAILLGMKESEVVEGEMINDAIGEVANMLVGQIKSRLTDRGFPCVLTIPSVVCGSHFSVEAITSTEGRLFWFQANDNHICIQFFLKTGAQNQKSN